VSLAVLPLRVPVAETTPLVLIPVAVAVTLTVMVQLPPAEIVPVLVPVDEPKLMPPSPATSVVLPLLLYNVPPQLLVVVRGEATVIVPGKVSEKATPLKGSLELGFVIVNVRVEVPPARIGFGANRFEMTGGLGLGQPVIMTLSM